MTRTRNALKVTPPEVRRIQELFVAGLRVADIVAETGRSESTVSRAVRGLKRRKPHPPARNAARDREIIRLVSKHGHSLGEVASMFGLAKTTVCQIVRWSLGLRRKRPPKSASVMPSKLPAADPPWSPPPLTRTQAFARNRRIARLARDGVPQVQLARRFGITKQRVGQILHMEAARQRRRADRSARNHEIVWRARAGWSSSRLAKRFGLTRGAVKSLIARARRARSVTRASVPSR